jgi:protein SCO1
MSGDSPLPRTGPSSSPLRRRPLHISPWLLFVALLLVAVAIGATIALAERPRTSGAPAARTAAPLGPAASWPAGARPAPDFRLHDENGRPISLSPLHGRVVILTFLDPLCRTFCPLEAKVLNRLERSAPAQRPAIVAVSVNPLGDRRSTLIAARTKWRLGRQWHWAFGPPAKLAGVWRRYGIEVRPVKGDVVHTEAAYVIDRAGHLRALFLWPFSATDVEKVSSGL